MQLLFISDNIAPLCGDSAQGRTVGHLAGALCALGHKITTVVPLRSTDVVQRYSLARRLSPITVPFPGGDQSVFVYDGRLPNGVEVRLLEHERFLEGSPDADDAPLLEAIVARAALMLASADVEGGATWHMIHGFATAGALTTYLSKSTPNLADVKTVLSVGDLSARPRCDKSWVDRLGLPWEDFTLEGFEFYGELDLVKAGLNSADCLIFSGLSATLDLQTEATGQGLDGLLRARRDVTSAVLPGLDYAQWSPATDAHLPVRFDAEKRDGKASCKASLQNQAGLPVRLDVPLMALIPPLADLGSALAEVVDRALRADMQIIAPKGLTPDLDSVFESLQAEWPRQVARVDLDEATLHLLLAGSDLAILDGETEDDAEMLLASSRYGALPIVRAKGIARDLVVDLTAQLDSGNGFLVHGDEPRGLDVLAVIGRACDALRRKTEVGELLARTMSHNLSWEHRARAVEQLYADVLK